MSAVELCGTSDRPVRVSDNDVEAFAAGLRGRLVSPSERDFDEVRAVWNGMIDRRPGLIARCADEADVRACVDFARGRSILVAVRGGGHNVSGNAVCDGGLVIDLSPMTDVRVDLAARTVRAEGGVTIGDLDRATQLHGLAVPMGVVTATGIAGLTLGGGLGWLRRRYGLSCDNLISADVVTADGRLVTADAATGSDLLWGLRGGGGNFGIVTSFVFRAHPVGPDVFFAFVAHSGAEARAALRFFREWETSAVDGISAFAILWHAPEIDGIPAEYHNLPGVVYLAMYSGDPAEGEKALQPLRDFGAPIADNSAVTPYLEVQRFFDEDYPAHEMRYYWKSRYLDVLSDEAIDVLIELNEASPSPLSTIDVWQLGGAMSSVGARDTAFGDRSAANLIGIESNWRRPQDDAACIAWGRKVYSALQPFSTGGEYLNFPGLYEDREMMIRGTFGDNLDRLRALKAEHDPTNFFRLSHNLRPA